MDIDEILKQNRNAGCDAFIPIHQEIQDADGFLSRNAVIKIVNYQGLSARKIYGVANLYLISSGFRHMDSITSRVCHVRPAM